MLIVKTIHFPPYVADWEGFHAEIVTFPLNLTGYEKDHASYQPDMLFLHFTGSERLQCCI
jgi:hypothetical protein